MSDFIINRGYLSTSVTRKIFNTIGHWVPMLSLIALAYTQDATWAIFILTLAVGLNGGVDSGFFINHIDLSPNFAGTLMGITNGLGNIWALVAPLVAGFILSTNDEDGGVVR